MGSLAEDPLPGRPRRSNSHQQEFDCRDGFRVLDLLPQAPTGTLSPSVSHQYPNPCSNAASDGAPTRDPGRFPVLHFRALYATTLCSLCYCELHCANEGCFKTARALLFMTLFNKIVQ